MSEAVHLPIGSNIVGGTGPSFKNAGKTLNVDLSNLTSNRTATLPDINGILPYLYSTDIRLGKYSYTDFSGNNVFVGPLADSSTSLTNSFVIGNITATQTNALSIASSITNFAIPGLANATTGYWVYYDTSTKQLSYGAKNSSTPTLGVLDAASISFSSNPSVGFSQPTTDVQGLAFWNGSLCAKFTHTQLLSANIGEESSPAFSFFNQGAGMNYSNTDTSLALAGSSGNRIKFASANQVLVQAGAVEQPSIYFSNDTTRGFYFNDGLSFAYNQLQTVNFADRISARSFYVYDKGLLTTNQADMVFNNIQFVNLTTKINNVYLENDSLGYVGDLGALPLASDEGGYAVAASGDGGFLAMSVPADVYLGERVDIYQFNGSNYSGYLTVRGGDTSEGCRFGNAIAMSRDGKTLAVGAPLDDPNGCAHVYYFDDTGPAWNAQGGKLVGYDVVGAAQSGASVALSNNGNTMVFGGPADNSGAGAAWVFIRLSSASWSQAIDKLVGTNAFGSSVAISPDGTVILVGNPQNNKVWIYSGTNWSVVSSLSGTNNFGSQICYGTSSRIMVASSDTVYIYDNFTLSSTISITATNSICMDGFGTTLYVASDTFDAYKQNETGVWVKTRYTVAPSTTVKSIACSADGNQVIAGEPNFSGSGGRTAMFSTSKQALRSNNSIYADSFYVSNPTNTTTLQISNTNDEVKAIASVFGSSAFYPTTDGNLDLGSGTNRFKEVFATNSTIITSDRRLKSDITDIDLGLDFACKLQPKEYDMYGKRNYGFLAQDLLQMGIADQTFVSIPKSEDELFGLNYGQFIPVLIESIKELAN